MSQLAPPQRTKTIAIDARKLRDFGIGTYVRELVRGLAKTDTPHRFLLLVRSLEEARAELGPLPDRFQLKATSARVYSVREMFAVSSLLKRSRADLYHATHYNVPLASPCPTVVTIHDLIHLLFPQFLPNRAALWYARWMLPRASGTAGHVIAVSQQTASDIEQHLVCDPAKISVIYNGVDASFQAPENQESERSFLLQQQLEPGYLLFVGNPKPHKNLARVIDAYSQALGQTPELPELVVAGAGASDAEVAGLIEGFGVGDRVRVIGHVESGSLPALYRAASLLVFPGLYEGFGLPVVEAMASGTAVLTSDSGALAEVAADAACTVDPESTEAISTAILKLSSSPTDRAELAERGRERAKEFSWQQAAEQTLAVYDRVLSGTASASDTGTASDAVPTQNTGARR